MPNKKEIEQRVQESWRCRACAAGLCVGAQVFLSGCAVGMPLALTSAWLSSLPALPFAAWLCACSRRALAIGRPSRARDMLLALTLLLSGAFALSSLVSFAAQTLVEQASHAWPEAVVLLAVLLCALSGGTGVSRLSFALRYALAAFVLGLSLTAVPLRVPVGLFPVLGAGAVETGTAALFMLFGAAPVLMLMLPPPEIGQSGEAAKRCPAPGLNLLLPRVLAGAAAGVFLLFLTCACTTYESIAESGEWGARLRMAAGNQAHEGILQMLLMTAKLLAMLLLAVNMLCAGEQALVRAFPALLRRRAGLWLAMLMMAACLAVHVYLGDAPILFGAPAIAAPAALTAVLSGRRRRA